MKSGSEGRWAELHRSIEWGTRLLPIGIAVTLGNARITDAFRPQELGNFPVPQLAAVLFVTTAAYILIWLVTASHEYQMFHDNFGESAPIVPTNTMLATLGLGIAGAALLYFSRNLVGYSAVFLCINIIGMWGGNLINANLRKALTSARGDAKPGDNQRDRWSVIEDYYLNTPNNELTIVRLFFTACVLMLGLLGQFFTSPPVNRYLLSAGYGLMVLCIAINETAYAVCRWKRDRALSKLDS